MQFGGGSPGAAPDEYLRKPDRQSAVCVSAKETEESGAWINLEKHPKRRTS